MRTTVHILCLLAGLASAGAARVAPAAFDTLDLPGAIQLALLQNRDLARTRLAVDSQRYSVRSAEAVFDWSLRPDGTVATSSESAALGYGITLARTFSPGTEIRLRGGYARTESDIEDRDSIDRSSVRLQLSQPLFRNAGALVQREGIVQAGHDLLRAWRLLEQRKAELAVQVAQVYEDIVRLDRQITADETFHDRVDRLYRLTQARENQGRSTRVDTLRVELLRGRAESRLSHNRERRSSRFEDLLALLGLASGTSFNMTPPPLLELDLPNDPQTAIDVALANRLELAQAAQNIDDTRRGIRLARRDLQPDLRLVTSVQQFGEGGSISDSTSFDESSWTVGLAADTDFVRTREYAALGQRVLDRESAQWQFDDVRDTIHREVRQGLLAYQRIWRELDIAERNLKLAGDRLRLSQRMFEFGRGDNFTVTDAEDEFISAEQQWLNARADASVEGYRLLRTMGTLVAFPDELRPQPETMP